MVQGSLKKNSGQKKSPRKTPQLKKGARTFTPKQAALVQQHKLQKQLSAKINANIERQMAVKANAVGKLTVMKKLAESAAEAGGKKKKGGKK